MTSDVRMVGVDDALGRVVADWLLVVMPIRGRGRSGVGFVFGRRCSWCIVFLVTAFCDAALC